jgi:hypothetical protein
LFGDHLLESADHVFHIISKPSYPSRVTLVRCLEPKMTQLISAVTTQLSYPLYAVDFDPQDANRLIVGGGGGGGVRSGVGNKIVWSISKGSDILHARAPLTVSSGHRLCSMPALPLPYRSALRSS